MKTQLDMDKIARALGAERRGKITTMARAGDSPSRSQQRGKVFDFCHLGIRGDPSAVGVKAQAQATVTTANRW